MAHESRENHFGSAHGLLTHSRISPLCGKVPGPLQDQIFFLLGSIPLYGLCPTHLSGKPPRYSSLLTGQSTKTLSHGLSGKHFPQHLGSPDQSDWRIYGDFAQILIAQARSLYAQEDFGIELEEAVYAFDATTIDLCLSVFPWAKFRQRKGAIKLHTLMDLRGSIPTLIFITHGKVHEINLLDELLFEPGAIYLFDRGYLDFARLYKIHQSPAFFIIRAKRNFRFRRLFSHPADKTKGIQADQTIQLHGFYSRRDYPDRLRRIRYFDAGKQKRLVFLTNNFTLPALTIAELFRCRWKIELFFKWIKQHLPSRLFMEPPRMR
jgi:hypothetical protein